jgi:hypothetical protein
LKTLEITMASIRCWGDRFEIRECLETDRGPRQHTLVSFRGVLTPEILDRAADKACKPFDREQLLERAEQLGIASTQRRTHPEARALLASLQRGETLDPWITSLLRSALEARPQKPLPTHLEEAQEWLGQPESERGKALRGLLRTADRILQARGSLRSRPGTPFPRFSSGGACS